MQRLGILILLVIAGPAVNAEAEFDVEPKRLVLRGANREQQLVVSAPGPNGLRDLTRSCKFDVGDGRVARMNGTLVEGVSDGSTTLVVSFDGERIEVPIVVEDFDQYPPVHFENDVLPIFTKLGCNSGGCHGKSTGQNGFKLSVFSFDPAADYETLLKQSRGRRALTGSPGRSLLLLKATAAVPHGGGKRLVENSRDYKVLYEWIGQGMPYGPNDASRLVSVEIFPTDRIVGFASTQQILVSAKYSDGTHRDVSSAATYTSNFGPVADVDESGLVTTGHVPGEAAITVNYMGQVAALRIQVPRPDRPASYPRLDSANPIDKLVWKKLEKMGVLPSPICEDAAFLRRASLDTIGCSPDPATVRTFVADSDPKKRARLIDQLLERDEFADLWALKWADILLVDSDALGKRGAYEFHRWLRKQFDRNRPYDEWVQELVTATGHSAREGPVNYYRALRTPEELARSVSQAFLGVRLECAQCHHHPFEKWGREDFYGVAGFFNGVERKKTSDGREVIFHSGLRETRIPVTNQLVTTRPLGSTTPPDLERGDPRLVLARWITSKENPWFAKLAVNRVVKHFLGRGLVDPEDDLRTTNPPTNAELLSFLEQSFIDSGYDLKALIRLLLNSRVYQLTSVPNESNSSDNQNFSRYFVKRLSAEVLLDAISHATGVPEAFPGHPPGTRAIELWDNRLPSYFLEIFGRPARNSPCECGRISDPTISQALHLMNAPEIERKISHPKGRVARLVASGASQNHVIEELCLAALGRFPSKVEQQIAQELFAGAPPREAAEDFLWTLLNSYDFIFVR